MNNGEWRMENGEWMSLTGQRVAEHVEAWMFFCPFRDNISVEKGYTPPSPSRRDGIVVEYIGDIIFCVPNLDCFGFRPRKNDASNCS